MSGAPHLPQVTRVSAKQPRGTISLLRSALFPATGLRRALLLSCSRAPHGCPPPACHRPAPHNDIHAPSQRVPTCFPTLFPPPPSVPPTGPLFQPPQMVQTAPNAGRSPGRLHMLFLCVEPRLLPPSLWKTPTDPSTPPSHGALSVNLTWNQPPSSSSARHPVDTHTCVITHGCQDVASKRGLGNPPGLVLVLFSDRVLLFKRNFKMELQS